MDAKEFFKKARQICDENFKENLPDGCQACQLFNYCTDGVFGNHTEEGYEELIALVSTYQQRKGGMTSGD